MIIERLHFLLLKYRFLDRFLWKSIRMLSSRRICSVLLSVSAIYILVSSSHTITTVTKPKLALRLIHRDSILSPHKKAKLESKYDVRAPLLPMSDSSIFLVNVSVGDPPVPQLIAMDTGSRLTWVQCKDCDSCDDTFNPRRSSTFSALSNNSPQCIKSKFGSRNQGLCTFSLNYLDHSSSAGFVGMEKFTFLTSTGGTMELPDVVFGCAQETSGSVDAVDGILALEVPDQYCLAARTGTKFSYCIGSINDPGYMYNQLILGDGAILQGDSTPMQMKDSHYVVTLEGITIGEKRLALNQREFFYNVVIDSGSTYIELRTSAYQLLVAEVKALIDGMLTRVVVRNEENQLCYSGNIDHDLKGFPIVTLHLAEGADLDLDADAMFQRTKDGSAFCMAVVEAEENIIGVKAQQYYNVGFDLDAMRISFQRIDCELLED